jgi:2-polyprenyl-3-methyl-5-hydroxy-6-metoxy-1,4-benzoquinol methylase
MTATTGAEESLSPDALSYLKSLVGRDVSRLPLDVVRASVEKHAALRLRGTRHRAIIELVGSGSVLDIGCDIGVLSKALSSRCSRVVALDVRPETIAIANHFFAAPNIDYRACDFLSLDSPAQSFDCALFLETIEHVEDPTATLARIHELLRPRGTLIISTPNGMSYHELLRQFARLWPSFRTDRGIRRLVTQIAGETPGSGTQDDHLFSWTWETLVRLAHRTGFRYVDHRRVSFWPPSLPLGSSRVWPFGRRELTFLRPLVGPFCQTLLLKLEAVK